MRDKYGDGSNANKDSKYKYLINEFKYTKTI